MVHTHTENTYYGILKLIRVALCIWIITGNITQVLTRGAGSVLNLLEEMDPAALDAELSVPH